MTLDEVREATREAVPAVEHLMGHLMRLRDRIAPDFPLTGAVVQAWPDEPRERLHAFLRMFEQLYDLAGKRLLRGFILLSGEDAAALSAKNLFRRVEALGGIESADRWIELGSTRNQLVHDYPIDADRQAGRANLAWDDLDTLLANSALIIRRLRAEELI